MKSYLRRIGPGFMTAAVVIGPGSITVMSSAGATYGYKLLWMPVFTAVFMATFTVLFMRLGVLDKETFFEKVRGGLGKPFAILCGASAYYIIAAFQFGNNIGVSTAMNGLLPGVPTWIWPLFFNALSLVFLFALKKVYVHLERLMVTLVVVMLFSFLANLCFASPNLKRTAVGLIPRIPREADWIALGGLVATTFSILAAISQSYLVRSKGWGKEEEREGRRDAIAGMSVLMCISMVILITSAAVLEQKDVPLKSASDMAAQLEALFGSASRIIFCSGLAAASLSSFIMNAMIGGILLSDSLGKGWRFADPFPKCLGAIALLVGMVLAILTTQVEGVSPVRVLVAAQAGTLLAVPLAVVASLFVLLSAVPLPKGNLRHFLRFMVVLGGLLLCATSFLTAKKIFGF